MADLDRIGTRVAAIRKVRGWTARELNIPGLACHRTQASDVAGQFAGWPERDVQGWR